MRQIKQELANQVCCVHMGWVPYVETAGEYKTKPMQHSVKELQRAGIQPDLLLLRAQDDLPESVLKRLVYLQTYKAIVLHRQRPK